MQRVDLQIQRPGGDFYAEQRQVRLKPNTSVVVPEDHVLPAQVENMRARRQITVSNVR